MHDIAAITGAATRLVVFHRPGPAWRHDRGPLEQDGLAEHVAYLQAQAALGLIERSGPLLSGPDMGMMLLAEHLDETAAQVLAEKDPAVVSALVDFEIRQWLVTIGGIPRRDAR